MSPGSIIIAPSIQTEGKIFQQVQRVGMGKSARPQEPEVTAPTTQVT